MLVPANEDSFGYHSQKGNFSRSLGMDGLMRVTVSACPYARLGLLSAREVNKSVNSW